MDPFDLLVLKALSATLESITVANGYQHDLAGAVFRGRTRFDQNDPLPMLAIIEKPIGPDEIESPTGSSTALQSLPLLVQGFVKEDPTNPTDTSYRLMADVRKALAVERKRGRGSDIFGMGPRIAGLHIGRGVVRPPDAAISAEAFFWLPITIEYGEDESDPYKV